MIEQFKAFPVVYSIAYYPRLGFLPIAYRDGEEVYRGEYQDTPGTAFNRILECLPEVE